MIWVGSFKSLQSALDKPRFGASLEVHTWLRSEIGLISPFVDWLMSLIAGFRCVRGKEEFVELALRETHYLFGLRMAIVRQMPQNRQGIQYQTKAVKWC